MGLQSSICWRGLSNPILLNPVRAGHDSELALEGGMLSLFYISLKCPDFGALMSSEDNDVPADPPDVAARTGPYALYARQVSLIVGVIIAVVALLYFIGVVFRLLLFTFAGVLLAVFLRGTAKWIHEHTGLAMSGALALVFFLVVVGLSGLGWILIPPLVEQVQELSREIPRALQQIESTLEEYGWGRVILSTLPDEPSMLMGDPGGDLWENLGRIATTTVGGLLDLLVFIVVGVSMAIEPRRYIDALVRLVPLHNRGRAREIFTILGEQLESWLVARFLTMVIVGLITALGLWILGVPNILVLSLLAGVFEFIPVVGPILSSFPAILLGLLVSPLFAFYIALFYWLVQSLESYLISPLLHQKIVKLAPALVIIAELVMALTLGFIGLVMATPLLVVTIVLIRLIYLENILGDEQEDLAAGH